MTDLNQLDFVTYKLKCYLTMTATFGNLLISPDRYLFFAPHFIVDCIFIAGMTVSN